jgi:hypothetical protein
VKIGDLVEVSSPNRTRRRTGDPDNHLGKVGIIVDGPGPIGFNGRFANAPTGWEEWDVLLTSGETAWFDPDELEVICEDG